MANYATLKAAIADVVKTNGSQAITGDNLQQVLFSIVNSIGTDYLFAGVATPSTSVGTPDQNVFYITGAGTFANMGSTVTIPVGSIGVFKYNGSWSTNSVNITNESIIGSPMDYKFSGYGYIKYADGTTASGGYGFTDFIPVTEGQHVIVYGAGSATVAIIAAYSSNTDSSYLQNKSVQGIPSVTKIYEYVVPSGVSYVRCSSSNGVTDRYVSVMSANSFFATMKEVQDVSEDIQDLLNNLCVIGKPTYYAIGLVGYIKYADGTATSAGYHHSGFIPVTEGQHVIAYGKGSVTVAVIAAYSSNTESSYLQESSVRGKGTASSDSSFYELVVPAGVNYVRCCSNDAITDRYVAIIDSNKAFYTIGEVDEKIEDALVGVTSEVPKTIRLYPKDALPCVSFTFDDCTSKDEDIHNLFKSYGLTCGFAFIASEANITAKASTYKNYQKEGFQILNHSVDAVVYNTTNYTYETAMAAIMTAKNRLEKAGMICNGFVAPSSSFAASFLPILGIAQAYAFTSVASSATDNGRQQDRTQLHRYSMESHTLAEIQQFIDDCITNDQIITFYGHPANLVDGDTSVFSIAKISAVIDYCIAKRNTGQLWIGGTDDCVKYFFDL